MNGELNQIKDCFVASTGFQRMRKTVNEGNSFLWNGCTGSSYALIGGCLADHTKRSILLVLPNVGDVERAAEDMAFFTDASLMTYPVLSETANKNNDDLSLIADDNFGKRLRVLKHFDEGNSKPVVVVTSLAAIIQSIPSQSEISTDSIHLEIGSEFGRDKLICWLNKTGFTSVTAVELPNEYSIRGDIVDIFAKDWERPVRIEFFGDEIDSIRNFNVVSQLSEEIDRLDSIDVTSISASGSFESRFTDRLPGDLLVLIVETSKTISETTRLLSTSLGEASATLVNETMNALYRRPTIHCVSIATGSEFAHESYDGQFVTVDKLQGDFSHVEKTLKTLKNEDVNRVFIVCGSETEQRRMETTFEKTFPESRALSRTLNSIQSLPRELFRKLMNEHPSTSRFVAATASQVTRCVSKLLAYTPSGSSPTSWNSHTDSVKKGARVLIRLQLGPTVPCPLMNFPSDSLPNMNRSPSNVT